MLKRKGGQIFLAVVLASLLAVFCIVRIHPLLSGGILSGAYCEMGDLEVRVEWHDGAGMWLPDSGEQWGLRVCYIVWDRKEDRGFGRGRNVIDWMMPREPEWRAVR